MLDVGCGTGLVTRAYAGRVARVVAVDVSSGLIRRARTNLAACANVALVQADAVRLPFRDHSFDHILFCGVVPYLTREELYAALREMKRACKRGGSIFVCDLCDTRREVSTILIYGGPTALPFLHYIGRRLRGRARRGWYHPREFADMARSLDLEPEFVRQAREMPFQYRRYDCLLIVQSAGSQGARSGIDSGS